MLGFSCCLEPRFLSLPPHHFVRDFNLTQKFQAEDITSCMLANPEGSIEWSAWYLAKTGPEDPIDIQFSDSRSKSGYIIRTGTCSMRYTSINLSGDDPITGKSRDAYFGTPIVFKMHIWKIENGYRVRLFSKYHAKRFEELMMVEMS